MNTPGTATPDEPIAGDEVTLGLLRAIEDEPRVTQRGLATRLGIALGLTNAVLRRAVAKGLVKVRSAPARRYAYYLTPQGFAEKSRLTLRYLDRSLAAVREARDAFAAEFAACARCGWTRVAVLGGAEMADIALLGAQEAGVLPVAVIDSAQAGRTRSGVPVVADAEAARALAGGAGLDAMVLPAGLDTAQRADAALRAGLAPDRLLAPAFLQPAHHTSGRQRDPDGAPAEGGA